jgi:hypothetical protein
MYRQFPGISREIHFSDLRTPSPGWMLIRSFPDLPTENTTAMHHSFNSSKCALSASLAEVTHNIDHPSTFSILKFGIISSQ